MPDVDLLALSVSSCCPLLKIVVITLPLILHHHHSGVTQVVEVDGEILEKPSDSAHAIAMLSRLRGREHLVHTGACLLL
jgi:hypothetical protein